MDRYTRRPNTRWWISLLVLTGVVGTAHAQGKTGRSRTGPETIEASVLTSMPVKELTVFKDGHAFVMHEDRLPTDGTGNVIIDTLPTPVLGTFWPYDADERAELTSVVAGTKIVRSERPTLSIRELIEANPGAQVIVVEQDDTQYEATIIGIPEYKPAPAVDQPAGTNPSRAQQPQLATPRTSYRSEIVLLRVPSGTQALPLTRIRSLLFLDELKTSRQLDQRRNLLTLQLDWGDKEPAEKAQVGMVYLQRGVRWIPNYRVEIDGAGQAQIKLQATLVNDLVDLDGVVTHLVIGVPSFRFQHLVDPIALQATMARMSTINQQQRGEFQQSFMNSIMTQVAMPADYDSSRAGSGSAWEAANPEIMASSRNEDLFLFTVPDVTLKKGERMVLTVAEFTLQYEDVFALDIDFAPPPELEHNRRQAIDPTAAWLGGPTVMHRIRLQNKSRYPLTTAPAIVLRDDRLLAQSMMRYTAIGAACDLDVTTAGDLRAENIDQETKRTPDALRWGNDKYGRIDLSGTIKVQNYSAKAAKIEVTRSVLGAVDTAGQEGAIEQTNAIEDVMQRQQAAQWWGQYNWPYWWPRVNGVGRIKWEITFQPGAESELSYAWHYFWR